MVVMIVEDQLMSILKMRFSVAEDVIICTKLLRYIIVYIESQSIKIRWNQKFPL